jgi:hypothetical protein
MPNKIIFSEIFCVTNQLHKSGELTYQAALQNSFIKQYHHHLRPHKATFARCPDANIGISAGAELAAVQRFLISNTRNQLTCFHQPYFIPSNHRFRARNWHVASQM